MKKSKKNYAIIVLIVILLALAVGYATFTASLTINGTVTGTVDWDVQFTAVDINGDGATSEDYGTGVISKTTADGDTLTVNVNLDYPGDACFVKATITNEGTLDAKLTGFTVDDSTLPADVTVTTPTMATNGSEIIEAGDSCEFTFVVKWANDSQLTTIGENKTFTITFDYTQNDEPVDLSPAHGEHN